jgi:hypothetical protein
VSGLTDLRELLATLSATVRPGRYVYVLADRNSFEAGQVFAMVAEDEGCSLVVTQQAADDAGLPYDFVAGWITLRVHSSLAAVGLTAAFSTALAEAGISCNVLAGLHHDHLLVPYDETDRALAVLRQLSADAPR